MKNRFPRSFYIPKGAVKIADKQSSAVVYVYDAVRGDKTVPLAVGFQGKADKPNFHYRYSTPARREQAVREFFASVQARETSRRQRAGERQAFTHNVQVGDIFRTSWGYDQTNVEFFEVTEIKGKFAMLREIESASRANGQGSESCVPQSGAFLQPRYQGDDRGQPMRRLIQQHGIKIDDVRRAYPWGKRGPGGIVIGEACHRTTSGWGH